MTRPRCDHTPAAFRNDAHKFDCARHHDNAITVIRLPAFELPHFCLGIEMRSDRANHFDRADAVSDGHHLVAVKTMLASPDSPLSLHRTCGIDENSIEIEKNGGAAESSHSFF